eukprot:TRINITY_DN4874_c0_g1_i1.p1 TRINITY_DN4874_c0_g1~~TRINITY_DN4874_c0_g1_i1.p1  ORF type:complete len:238 (+),score=64.11 TRINITY_DN4874_c0_g1_i1:30-716(+)
MSHPTDHPSHPKNITPTSPGPINATMTPPPPTSTILDAPAPQNRSNPSMLNTSASSPLDQPTHPKHSFSGFSGASDLHVSSEPASPNNHILDAPIPGGKARVPPQPHNMTHPTDHPTHPKHASSYTPFTSPSSGGRPFVSNNGPASQFTSFIDKATASSPQDLTDAAKRFDRTYRGFIRMSGYAWGIALVGGVAAYGLSRFLNYEKKEHSHEKPNQPASSSSSSPSSA